MDVGEEREQERKLLGRGSNRRVLWTLEQGFGDGFTPEVREAWTLTYGIVAPVMKEAAGEAAVAGGQAG